MPYKCLNIHTTELCVREQTKHFAYNLETKVAEDVMPSCSYMKTIEVALNLSLIGQ